MNNENKAAGGNSPTPEKTKTQTTTPHLELGKENDPDSAGQVAGGHPYDETFHTLVREEPNLLVPLVNDFFGMEYIWGTKATLLESSYQEDPQDPNSPMRQTDSIFSISDESNPQENGVRYLIECETTKDNDVEIRFFRYGGLQALRDRYRDENGRFHFRFPRMGLLYLRPIKTAAKQDVFYVEGEGTDATLELPLEIRVIKAYDVNHIIEKDLFFLVPFWAFKRPATIWGMGESFKTLHNELEPLLKWIDDSVAQGKISDYTRALLYEGLLRVFQGYCAKHPNTIEEVKNMVGYGSDWTCVREHHQLMDLQAAMEEKDKQIGAMNQQHAEDQKQIGAMNQQHAEDQKRIEEQGERIEELEKILADHNINT